jgi:hypothetical protein
MIIGTAALLYSASCGPQQNTQKEMIEHLKYAPISNPCENTTDVFKPGCYEIQLDSIAKPDMSTTQNTNTIDTLLTE